MKEGINYQVINPKIYHLLFFLVFFPFLPSSSHSSVKLASLCNGRWDVIGDVQGDAKASDPD